MKVLYVDLETTGLDPETCQILQVGMLWDDGTGKPLDLCPQIEFLVRHDVYQGDAYALWLNRDILKQLSQSGVGVRADKAAGTLGEFFRKLDLPSRILVGGKNVAGFDLPFLSKLPGFKGWSLLPYQFMHRTVDPAMMYARENDDAPPNLDTCLERAGITKRTVHTALDDCKLCCELVRRAFEFTRPLAWEYSVGENGNTISRIKDRDRVNVYPMDSDPVDQFPSGPSGITIPVAQSSMDDN